MNARAPGGRLHVMHVVLSLAPGGLENGVVNIANGLDPAKFRSSICCLKTAGEFAARLAGHDVAVHEMRSPGGIDWRLVLRLARLFRRVRADIVHSRNAEAFYYAFVAAKLAGVPAIVHSEHGRTFSDRPLRFHVQRWFSRHTDRIYTVSEELRRELVARVRIPAERIGVLYNGVDLERFNPAAGDDALRASLKIPPGALVVGSVGRLVPVKNYGLLIDAARGLPSVHVVLAGEGPERAALAARAAAAGMAGRVHFLGHRNDVARVVRGYDVFVLPSVSEGMSNTLLEAMAAGVPVAASRVGGNPEIVRDGIDGLLFESGDAAGLAACLARLAAPATRATFGAAARARVASEFAMSRMVSRYEDAYRSLVAA